MTGLADRAVIVSVSRIANYGLMLISPVVLTRVLSVDQFGIYREFLLYATLLLSVAGFNIQDSLLYFVPTHPNSQWRIVRRTTALVACTSVASVLLLIGFDIAFDGALVGSYLVPLVIYVLLFINVDFWEPLLVAAHRPFAVLPYVTGRLLARLVVVICAGLITHDVNVIIWSLVGLESVRLILSVIVWRRKDTSAVEPPLENSWREQLNFCAPSGAAVLVAMMSHQMGSVAIAKVLGPIALAHYTIGTYAQPIVFAIRNAISAVLLPEMVRRNAGVAGESLALWHRATIINCILLIPTAIVTAYFAEPLVVTVFGESYRSAIPVLQLYGLLIVRACFDFAPPLRAINSTGPLLYGNIAAVLANVVALFLFLPRYGVPGALIALALASFVECGYLAGSVKQRYQLAWRQLIPWGRVLKVSAAALAAAPVLLIDWTGSVGFAGVFAGSAVYFAAFGFLLWMSDVAEATVLFDWVHRTFLKRLIPARP